MQLAPGEYTLTEITAPDGYEVAESIDFTVNEDGLVGSEKVVMEDQKKPEIPEIPEVPVVPEEPKPETIETPMEEPKPEIPPVVEEPEKPAPKTPEVPTVKTIAEAGANGLKAEKDQIIIDKVRLTNLIEGVEYTVTGKLMIKDGSENGTEVATYTCEPLKFVATAAAAEAKIVEVEMRFTGIDATELGGQKLVVFETLTWETDVHGKINEVPHEDINDEDQTVEVEKPEIPNLPETPGDNPPPPELPNTGQPETPTNNTPPTPSVPTTPTRNVPATGDVNNMMLWMVLGAVAAFMAATVVGLRRR